MTPGATRSIGEVRAAFTGPRPSIGAPSRILLEVERETEGVAGKLQHLAVTHVGEAVNAGDAVGDRDDRADVAGLGDGFEILDPLLDEIADLGRLDGHIVRSCGL